MTVKATFRDRDRVAEAVQRLGEKSVPADVISVRVVDADGRLVRTVPVKDESGALPGALWGAAAGATLGLVLVLLTVTGVLGPADVELFSMRSAFGALRTIAVLAAGGVPLGALVGMSFWHGAREIPVGELDSGRIEVVVESEEMEELATTVLKEEGADTVE